MRNGGLPFRKKFRILMPRDFFDWVLVSGCFEGGQNPYLHAVGCNKVCGTACNHRGVMMGKLIQKWKEGESSGHSRFFFN